MSEYKVSIGTQGIRREIGEVINIGKDGVTFQYKQPRSSKRVQIKIAPKQLLVLKDNGAKSEVIFLSNMFEMAEYRSVTGVKDSPIPGIWLGATKREERLHFSPLLTTVTTIISKKRKEKKVKGQGGQVQQNHKKKNKGKKILAKKL